MFTDNEKDSLVSNVADRIREDMDAEDPRCWIVQRCTQKWVGTEIQYEDWPGYDIPTTHDQMLRELHLCERLFPQHEFRGHRVRPTTSEVGRFPGSSTSSSGEPGIFPKDGDR